MIGKADNDEDDSKNDEAHNLDGFTANCIDGCDGDPVSRDCTCACYDEISDGLVEEDLVDVLAFGIADLRKNDGVVKTET
jgi:hypothetical protein